MQELQGKLEHQAFHDPLTDLANRMLFPDRVDDALARDPESVSVIFVDINDFKNVNDTLGHAAGDELLVAIARRLSDCLRPADTLARMGGDEFAILLEQAASRDEAIDVAERINGRLAERFSVAGRIGCIGGRSYGIAAALTARTLGELSPLRRRRMYQAEAGRRALLPALRVRHAGSGPCIQPLLTAWRRPPHPSRRPAICWRRAPPARLQPSATPFRLVGRPPPLGVKRPAGPSYHPADAGG